MLSTERIQCPYCGEVVEVIIDASVEHQSYIEDCHVCCRPITLDVRVEFDGEIIVGASHEND